MQLKAEHADSGSGDTAGCGCRAVRWRWLILLGLAAFVLALVGWNRLADHFVISYERGVLRDADTNIMVGAQPRTLGPADAPVAVLLVHGFVGGATNLGDLPDQLAARDLRVRAMRLPGHGTTPHELEGVAVDEYLGAVMAELGDLRTRHETVILVGHSMGGALSTLTASQARVDGLVLLAPYFGVAHRWYYVLRPETWAKVVGTRVRWLHKGPGLLGVNQLEDRDRIMTYSWVPTQSVVTLMELGRRVNTPDVLDAVTCPVLLIQSRRDMVASPGASVRALDAMATDDKRAVWLERSNHVICWDYERDEVTEEVVEFVKSIAETPAMPAEGPGPGRRDARDRSSVEGTTHG